MKTVEAVECCCCGTLHEIDSEDYVAFHGNVTIGMKGGLIGNNLDEEGRVANVSIYCRNKYCLKVPFLMYLRDSVPKESEQDDPEQ